MSAFTYVGPFDEVEVPALGVVVKLGEQVEATGEHADSLKAQPDNWQPVKPARKKETD